MDNPKIKNIGIVKGTQNTVQMGDGYQNAFPQGVTVTREELVAEAKERKSLSATPVMSINIREFLAGIPEFPDELIDAAIDEVFKTQTLLINSADQYLWHFNIFQKNYIIDDGNFKELSRDELRDLNISTDPFMSAYVNISTHYVMESRPRKKQIVVMTGFGPVSGYGVIWKKIEGKWKQTGYIIS